jgi:exonuclease SbcC
MKINPLSPKWQHSDPEVRLQSVLSGKLSPEVLSQLAAGDADDAVKRAAINLIEDHNALLQIATAEQVVSPDAATRWAILVGADLSHIEVINKELPALLTRALAIHAPTEDFRLRATEYLATETELLEILLSDNLSRVHQHCAGRLEDESSLRTVQQHFLDKDKNVARIVKSKLQVLNQTRAKREAHENAVAAVQEKLQQLVNADRSQEYRRRVDVLKHQWLELAKDPFSEPYKATITELVETCEAISESIPDLAEIRQQQLKVLVERCEHLTAECKNTPHVEHLASTLADILSAWPEDEHELRQLWTAPLANLANMQRRWHELVINRANMNLNKFKTQLAAVDWPEAFPKPVDFNTVSEEIETELKQNAEKDAERQAAQKEIEQVADKLETEVTAGHIKAAKRASSKLNSLLTATKPSSDLNTRITLLNAKLQELKDWQGFATQPKRDELCEKMKVLSEDLGIAPPEKAKAIKELQDEWKNLGPSESRAAQKSWSRFKKLGDKAFLPCSEYFAEQEQIRLLNLQEREKICASLELINSEHDWSTTDWKAMSEITNKAKQEWRQYVNVPRRNKKAIEKRFDQALNPILDRLKQEQSVNAEKKRALIQEITDLLEAESETNAQTQTNTLVETAKRAQQRWKDIGITDRRQDQKLWKAFRSQCDAVFNRRDEHKQIAKQAASETATAFREVCKGFQQRLESDTPISQSDISAFRKESSSITLEPQQRGLQAEATSLIKKAENQLKQQVKANQEHMFQEYQRRCQLLDRCDKGEISKEDAERQFDTNIVLDKKLTEALNSRVERSAEDQELLIIRLEILADLPSPEASQAARMAYQVQRLNRELSQGVKETRSEREQVQALLSDWFSAKNKADSLLPRFEQVASKLKLSV